MICTQFYSGQGLGNQLWAYAVCRTLALDRGYKFGIQSPRRFKGRAFMNLDFGEPVHGVQESGPSSTLPDGIRNYVAEHKVAHVITNDDITPLDPRLLNIQDETKIDGNFQAEAYIRHRQPEIRDWMMVSRVLDLPDDLCVISFRGGEYQFHSNLMLGVDYYKNAMAYTLDFEPNTKFLIVTDDPKLARNYFSDVPIYGGRRIYPPTSWGIKPMSRSIGRDFAYIQSAKKLILSNSSFSWWGAWTNANARLIIAPKFWARHNVSDGYWAQGDSLTRDWLWLSRDGQFQSFDECAFELERYRQANPYSRGLSGN